MLSPECDSLVTGRPGCGSGLRRPGARRDSLYCRWVLTDGSKAVILGILKSWRFRRRIASLHAALGIPADYGRQRALPQYPEASKLVSIGQDVFDREQRLLAPAATAWRAMAAAAAGDGVTLQVVSAFRSVAYQEGIVRRKLARGQRVEDILQVTAAPGFSEHHSGRAVDVTTPDYPVLEEVFEESEAFAWLSRRAGEFGFLLSYPRDNPHGLAYEPWHWAWWGDR